MQSLLRKMHFKGDHAYAMLRWWDYLASPWLWSGKGYCAAALMV